MVAWTAMAAFGMVLARHYRGVLGGKCLGLYFVSFKRLKYQRFRYDL